MLRRRLGRKKRGTRDGGTGRIRGNQLILIGRIRRVASAFVALALISAAAHATSSPQADRAIAWLAAQPQTDGSVAGELSSIATAFQARSETLVTLKLYSTAPTALVGAISGEAEDSTEYIARKIVALSAVGSDVSEPLANLALSQNSDGGFGGAPGYQSNPLDTAFAILALNAAHNTSAPAASSAVAYLISAQSPDGSFAINEQSSVYVTAYVLQALAAIDQTYDTTFAANAASTWLVGQQSAGAYSTVLDNATAAIALASHTSTTASFSGAQAALVAAQAADGSWSDDPYLTAIAIRALTATGTAAPSPTSGEISGITVDASSSAPVSGVLIQAVGAISASTNTSSAGNFTLGPLPAGSYTVAISKSGYATITQTVTVVAGAIANLGTVRLSPATANAGLQGQVTDGVTHQPIAGATVSAGGVSAATDANGNYSITNIAPGTVQVSVAKTGYQTINATATLASGVILVYSPSLYPPGQGPNAASLTGTVVDAATNQPIAGAVVTVGSQSATTDANGAFTLNGLSAGAVSIVVSASGYNSATLTGSLANGSNSTGVVALSAATTNPTLSGVVTDAGSGQPIGGATVAIQGTALIATTNSSGAYSIAGLTQTQFTVVTTAPGYQSSSTSVTLTQLANATLNIALARSIANGVSITTVTTDSAQYPPQTDINVVVSLHNAGAIDAVVTVQAIAYDASGNPAFQVVGQATTVPAGGDATAALEASSGNLVAGTYSLHAQALDGAGNLLSERSTSFDITGLAAIGGNVTLDPPIAQAGTATPVHVTASVRNSGNEPIAPATATVTLTLANVDPNAPSNASATLIPGSLFGSPLNQPVGGGYDSAGNFYTVNTADRLITRMAVDGSVTTLGTVPATVPGTGTPVNPTDATVDPAGNVYVLNASADIVKFDTSHTFSRVVTGVSSQLGFDRDANGSFYILDLNGTITRVDPNGTHTALTLPGLNGPRGVARASDGNLYVANLGDGSITRVDPVNGTISTLVPKLGISAPIGLTFGPNNSLYVANNASPANVLRVGLDGSITPYATGFSSVSYLAFDTLGSLYAINPNTNSVSVVPPGGGAAQVIAQTIVKQPQGMAFDAAGNLYVAGSSLVKLDTAGNVSTLSTSIGSPSEVAIGASGEIYVASGSGSITKTVGTTTTTFATGLSGPYGLAFDGASTIYVTESSANPPRISAVDSAGNVTTVAQSIISSPEAIRIAANGDRYILNDQYIALAPVSGIGKVVFQSNTLAAQSFVFASDGGYWIQEQTAVKRISPAGVITVIKSGLPTLGNGIAVDASGNVLVADNNNKKILRIDGSANVTTLATLTDFPTAIVDDLAGGVYVALSFGNFAHVTASGVVTTLSATRVFPAPTRLSFDPIGNKIYYYTGSGVSSFDIATATVTSIASNLNNFVAIEYGAGQINIVGRFTQELDTVSLSGQVTQVANGFNSAQAVVWDGSRIIFGDQNRLYSLTPGGLPKFVASASFNHMMYRNGVVFGTSRNVGGLVQTVTIGVDSSAQAYLSTPTAAASGIALRSDGGFAVANPNDASIWIYGASGTTPVKSYAGINNPSGIAVDPTTNTVFVATGNQIVKLGAGGQSSAFAQLGASTTQGMAFDASGQMYVTLNNNVGTVSSNGTVAVVGAANGSNTLSGLVAAPEGIFAADGPLSVLRKVSGGQLVSFASGLSGPKGMKADGQGGVYVANNQNGTVAHITGGKIVVVASGLLAPRSIAFAADGEMLVASDDGRLSLIGPNGTPTVLVNFLGLYNLSSFQVNAFVRSPLDGQLAAVVEFRNEVDRITFTPASAPPVGQATTLQAAVPAVPVGATSPTIDFGNFTPTIPGDYSVALTLPGASGQIINQLHVGPNATATISAATPRVAPGNPTVAVNVAIAGADFSSVAKIHGTATTAMPQQAVGGVSAIGADATGNTYVLDGATGTVWQFSPNGSARQPVITLPRTPQLMAGGLPIDDQNNLYVAQTTSSGSVVTSNLLRFDLSKIGVIGYTPPTIATYSHAIKSLAGGGGGIIYVATTDGALHSVASDGSNPRDFSTGVLPQVQSLTSDAKGNVYTFSTDVSEFKPDGTRVPLLNTGPPYGVDFENGMGVAGDCADNIFVMPAHWNSLNINSNEEQYVVSFITRTGVASQIFDARTITQDPNNVFYDRLGGNLLIDDDGDFPRIMRLPVTCGAISTDLHIVFPANQPTFGTSVAPKAIMAHSDGSQEYVWSFADVTNFGQLLSFSTTLQSLVQGETRPVASSAFLSFQNTFVPGTVTVPVKVPTVSSDGMVDLTVSTDQPQYPANTDVITDVHLTNRDAVNAREGNLTVTITDSQGVLVTQALQESVTVPAGATLDVNPPFNTGAYLTGSYLVKAVLTDPATSGVIASASSGFLIVADAVTVISAVSTDKQSYNALDTVNVLARVTNVSVNDIASDLTLHVVVKDPSGNVMLDRTSTIASLGPQALRDTTFVLRLQAATPGAYTVTETLSDSTGTTIDSHVATFAVLSTVDTGSGLSGAVMATRLANQGDSVAITVTATNQGNATLSNLPITISVVNPATGAAVTQVPVTMTVPQGGQQAVSASWNTTGVGAGTYVVGATATFGGRTISLGQAPVTIGVIQPFSFAAVANAPTSTLVESPPVTISGIVAPATVSITGGEFKVNDGAWSGSVGSIPPGALLTVRVTTEATFNTTTTASITVAGFTTAFSATTINPDTTPDSFTFVPLTNAPQSTLEASNTVTITGINAPAPISITGGEYSVNGGAFTNAPGMVSSGDTVTVRQTSSGSLGATTTVTLTIGGVSGTFTVTTTAADAIPDAFAFTPQSNVAPSTVVTSNTVTITGINVAVPITIAGGTYSVNGGAFTSAAGTISNGQTVAVQQTSSASSSTTTTAVLTVGAVTGSFSVTTQGGDTTPDPFSFTPQTDVPLNTVVTSNSVTIRGISSPVPISVAGGTYSVNAGGYTAASGTVNPLDTVMVRQTSSSSFATTTTATLTVSSISAPFAATTKTKADVTTTPALSSDERLLALISCKSTDDGPDDTTCDAQRAAFLDTYLTSLGITHKIVTMETDFKSEFRSGRYDAYWISGGADKLEDEVANELVEAGFRGETVVIDGVHDSRNRVLDDVVGVLYKGKPSGLDTVTLTGAFLPSGSFTPSGAKPIRVDLTAGVGQAKFNTGDPGIVTSAFGQGRGLLFAFDLVGTLQVQATSTLLQAVTAQSLDYVAPNVPAAFTGGAYVPFSLTLKNNEAVTVTMDVSLTLPAGFLLVSTSPTASQSGMTVTWHVTANPGATVSLSGAVRTPDVSGTYSLPIVVTQTYGSSSVQIGTFPIAVVVQGLDTALPQVIAAVQALSLPSAGGEANSRNQAVAALQSAQTAIGQARWEDAIASLNGAANDLDAISSIDTSGSRVVVDDVMKQIEERWWASLPVCPSASPCRTP